MSDSDTESIAVLQRIKSFFQKPSKDGKPADGDSGEFANGYPCLCREPGALSDADEKNYLHFITERDYSVPYWTESDATYNLHQPVEREYICDVCGEQRTLRTGRQPDGDPKDHIKVKAKMPAEERAHFVHQWLGGGWCDPDSVRDDELVCCFKKPDNIKPLSQGARENSPEFEVANGISNSDRPADWDHFSLRDRAEAERLRKRADGNGGEAA